MNSHSQSPTKISVVVPCLNEAADLLRTIEQLQATLPEESEIVVVDDGSTDGSADLLEAMGKSSRPVKSLWTERIGVARARNLGARHATGEVIVFSDAHVNTPAGWWQPLVEVLANSGVGAVAPAITAMGLPGAMGYGMAWNGPELSPSWLGPKVACAYPVPLLCGCFIAMRRDVIEATGGFDEGMTSYGSEDLELSLRLWLLGYDVLVLPEVEVAHKFRERHPYAVEWKSYLYNLMRIIFAHFSPSRISRVVETLKSNQDFGLALSMAVESDIWARRSSLAAGRVRDDEWYFHRFKITC